MKDLSMTPSSGNSFWDWLVHLFTGESDDNNYSGGNNTAFYNAADDTEHIGSIDGPDMTGVGAEVLYGDIGKQAYDSIQAERKGRLVYGAGSSSFDVADPNEDINPTLDNSQTINDASVYGNIIDGSVEDKLGWLIQNDPENAQGWLESLLGLQASRENTQQARDYEKEFYGQRAQLMMKDLEAAGINPILAANYLSGGSSVGAASTPDYSVSTNATNRYTTKLSNAVANNKTIAGILTALIAAIGLVGSKMVGK